MAAPPSSSEIITEFDGGVAWFCCLYVAAGGAGGRGPYMTFVFILGVPMSARGSSVLT